MTHSELECWLQQQGWELLRQLLQDHLRQRAFAEQKVEVRAANGSLQNRVRPSSRQLESLFGRVEVERLAYTTSVGPQQSLHPLDGELNLPREIYSHGVRRLVAEECAGSSFEEVVETIKRRSGAHIGKRQCEELAVRAAADFARFYEQREANIRVGERSPILVLSTDGKGVVVRREELREATRRKAEESAPKLEKRRSKGEKANRKRMASVASVYTIARHERTVEEVVRELREVEVEAERKRPRPEEKRVWASVERACGRDHRRSIR